MILTVIWKKESVADGYKLEDFFSKIHVGNKHFAWE